MKHRIPLVSSLGVALLVALGPIAMADVHTGTRPKDATGICKDGTFASSNDQATACTRNGGVQEWWGGKIVAPKDVPDARSPYDKADHPKPVTPPAGSSQR